MKAFVINGSPRKKWNTAQAIDKAGEALKDNGFEVERIDLYDYTFKGMTALPWQLSVSNPTITAGTTIVVSLA